MTTAMATTITAMTTAAMTAMAHTATPAQAADPAADPAPVTNRPMLPTTADTAAWMINQPHTTTTLAIVQNSGTQLLHSMYQPQLSWVWQLI